MKPKLPTFRTDTCKKAGRNGNEAAEKDLKTQDLTFKRGDRTTDA